MTYAKHHGADYLIDVATLTGGVITALGMDMTGAMTNDTEFYEQVVKASEEAGEPIWRLPITEKDKERVRNSKIADLNNSPGGRDMRSWAAPSSVNLPKIPVGPSGYCRNFHNLEQLRIVHIGGYRCHGTNACTIG